MSRIVLSGYYGFGNIGDEAILFSIIKELRRKERKIEIVVLSGSPEETSKSYKVDTVKRWNFFQVLCELIKADLLISGGGSLLQDIKGLRSILYYLGIILLAKLLGKPVFFYAQGVGPVQSYLGKVLVRLVINMVDEITVRDRDSKEFLAELGVRRSVWVTADPVLGLKVEELHRDAGGKLLKRTGIDPGAELEKPIVAFAIRDWKGLQEYKKAIARVADDLVRQGWQVLLLPMHFPTDVAACRELENIMEEESKVLKEKCSVEEMMGVFTYLELVVGVRLHALILAAVAGVPFVAVSYDPKIDAFLKEMEVAGAGKIETLDYEWLSRTVKETIAEREKIHTHLKERAGDFGKVARKTAERALKYVKK